MIRLILEFDPNIADEKQVLDWMSSLRGEDDGLKEARGAWCYFREEEFDDKEQEASSK